MGLLLLLLLRLRLLPLLLLLILLLLPLLLRAQIESPVRIRPQHPRCGSPYLPGVGRCGRSSYDCNASPPESLVTTTSTTATTTTTTTTTSSVHLSDQTASSLPRVD